MEAPYLQRWLALGSEDRQHDREQVTKIGTLLMVVHSSTMGKPKFKQQADENVKAFLCTLLVRRIWMVVKRFRFANGEVESETSSGPEDAVIDGTGIALFASLVFRARD